MSQPDDELIPKVIYNSVRREVVSRAAYPTGTGWLHAPAMLELLAVAYRNLVKVAGARGMDAGEVKYVRAARVPHDERVYVFPTDERDPDRIEVKTYDGTPRVNLRSLLDEAQRLLPPGHRVRYDIDVVGPESPVREALVFDLSLERERRVKVRGKKSD